MKQIEKDVLVQMSKVFERNGSRKFCGREACMRLIALSMAYHKYHYEEAGGNLSLYTPPNYGNLKTGCIDKNNEHDLLVLRTELRIEQSNERFLWFMRKVYTKDGDQKKTKPSICRKLIKSANKLDGILYEKNQLLSDEKVVYDAPYYGNIETGELNTVAIFELYKRL